MNSKKDSEALMNELLPLAKKMLEDHAEFYPYGGYMTLGGEIIHVGAKKPGTSRPKSKDLIEILETSFEQKANSCECKSAAIIFDVVVSLPNSNRRSNAIEIRLDHINNYSVELFFPYRIVDHKVLYDGVFSQEGSYLIFKTNTSSGL